MDNEELLFMNANLPEQPAMLNWSMLMDPNLARNSDCIMWEKSTDQQHSIFDSALSSLVSSPEKSSDSFVIIGKLGYGAPMTELSGDPGFSCFGSRSFNGRTDNRGLPVIRNSGKLTRVSSTPALKALVSPEFASRRRKSKELPISPSPSFSKAQEKEGKKKREEEEESTKAHDEPPKDYIHVRARRGQATDSHSLAERVRREKIGERMKLLQDLVPGCNKVTGKALMLDQIINYVQSLQRQVEFLSMKLSSANDTRLDFNVETLVSKDITIPSSSNRLHEETLQSVSSNHHHHQLNNYNYNNSQLHANISSSNMMLQSPINSMETSTLAGSLTHLPTLTQFTDSISQV